MSKREKIRTIVIDEVEIVTSLSATDIASLEKENKELKKQLESKDKIIDEMQNDVFEAFKRLPGTAYKMFGNKFCVCNDCDDINRELTCKDCMKIYYENKIKEN